MRYILIFILAISAFLKIYCLNTDTTGHKDILPNVHSTYKITGTGFDFHELEDDEQQLIQKSCEGCIKNMVNNDLEALWYNAHSTITDSTPLSSFQANMAWVSKRLAGASMATFIDAKKISYDRVPEVKLQAIGGISDQSDPNYISYYSLPGAKEQCIAIYHVEKYPLAQTIVFKLGFEDGEYKWMYFFLNSRSIKGKDSNYYIQLADKWKSEADQYPRLIALSMASRLAFLGDGTKNNQTMRLVNERSELCKNDPILEQNPWKWEIGKKTYRIVNINFFETDQDIILNIDYISQQKFTSKKVLKESAKLNKFLNKTHPVLFQEFNQISFSALKEYTSDLNKKVEAMQVIYITKSR